MKDLITVAKKELRSLCADKLILAQILLFPFAIVCGFFLLSSAMGEAAVSTTETDARELLGLMVSSMMLMAAFMPCSNLAAETVAGDRDRGFLPMLLIAPVRRSSIAAGKALALFAAAAVSSLSAFLGMAAALPALSEALGLAGSLSLAVEEYLLLFLTTVSAAFAMTGMLLILSTLSKDVRQSTSIAPALIMILMVCGMLTTSAAFRQAVEELGLWNSVIPAWNATLLLSELVTRTHTAAELLLTWGVNVLFAALCIAAVARCFEQERIINR